MQFFGIMDLDTREGTYYLSLTEALQMGAGTFLQWVLRIVWPIRYRDSNFA